jgi:3-dehydroquinate synthetase
MPVISFDRLLELIRHGKKVFGDAPSWILPVGVGRAVVSRTVSEADLVAVLEERSV